MMHYRDRFPKYPFKLLVVLASLTNESSTVPGSQLWVTTHLSTKLKCFLYFMPNPQLYLRLRSVAHCGFLSWSFWMDWKSGLFWVKNCLKLVFNKQTSSSDHGVQIPKRKQNYKQYKIYEQNVINNNVIKYLQLK